jgi:hypothetical protein
VFDNRVLRRIFGPERDVAGGWRIAHDEKLHYVYASPNIIRVTKTRSMRWVGHVARMGEMRNEYNILVGRPDGKRILGKPRRKWEDNIRIDVDWIHLAQDRDQW